MRFRSYIAVCLGLTLATPAFSSCPGSSCPAKPSLLGVIASGIMIEGINRNSRAKTKNNRSKQSARSQAAQVERTKVIQEALNVLGFDAGTVDGIPGQRTRAAIRGYQAAREFPVTGRLSTSEEEALKVDFANARRIRSPD